MFHDYATMQNLQLRVTDTVPNSRPGTVGDMARPPILKWPKMPVELPGEDQGTENTTLGVIRSRVGSFIPGKRSKIWGAAISLGHV